MDSIDWLRNVGSAMELDLNNKESSRMYQFHRFARMARLAKGATGAVLLIAFAVTLPAGSGGAQQATPGVIGTPATTECATDIGTTEISEGETAYSIVSEESAARYRAQEELASIGANEAVGETNAVIGTVLLGEDGMPHACSRFDVDLRTLTSDEARRDNYLYDNTLKTGQYPLATFILTSVEGLDGPLVDGEAATLTLVGNLTIHGETRLIAWDATVTIDGDALTGRATTTFDMADFAIEKPVVGPVVSVNETIALEIDLTAERAA